MRFRVVLRSCRPVSRSAPAAYGTDSTTRGFVLQPTAWPDASDHASLPSFPHCADGHEECSVAVSLTSQRAYRRNPCRHIDAGSGTGDDGSPKRPAFVPATSRHVDWHRSRLAIAGFHGRRRVSCVSSHFFPRSVGFGPTASCASGAFPIAPSMLCQAQAIPSISAYSARPRRHIFTNTPQRFHFRKYECTELALPYSLGRAFHWQPVRRTNTIPSNTLRGGMRLRPPPGRRLYLRPGIRLGQGISDSTRFQRTSDTVHDLNVLTDHSIAVSHRDASIIYG